MNDHELRALVRDAVARHLGRGALAPGPAVSSLAAAPSGDWHHDASHAVYLTLVNTTEACVIEPDVPCTHCNYCKSHGH
jgi:hypothetical protein